MTARAAVRAVAAAAASVAMAAAVLVGGSLTAGAANDAIFTVGSYPVEARAGDAVAAKSRAIAEGQKAALRSLVKRLVPVTAYARVRKMQFPDAARLVDSFSVRKERNSTTDYIATLDFKFNEQGVRALLEREGLPFAETQAGSSVLVPVWRAPADIGGLPTAVGPIDGPKSWSEAWRGLDLTHALTPVKVEALKTDVHADTLKALAAGDLGMWRTFASSYSGPERLIAAIAEPDPATKKLKVTLIGQDAVGGINWRTTYRIDLNDPVYAIELAAVVSLRVLEGRWKATAVRAGAMAGAGPQAIGGGSIAGGSVSSGPASGVRPAAVGGDAGDGGPITLNAEFRGMAEWQDISRRLAAVPGVENLEVLGLSGRSARVTLSYAGGPERLAETLGSLGLSMRNAGQGWVVAVR